VGDERAGKTFPERVGGGKATLHAGDASGVRITLKCLFPETAGEAERAPEVGGEQLCSAGLLTVRRDVAGDRRREGHCHTLTVVDEPLNASCGKELWNRKNSKN